MTSSIEIPGIQKSFRKYFTLTVHGSITPFVEKE
jgi:hypothetical protein